MVEKKNSESRLGGFMRAGNGESKLGVSRLGNMLAGSRLGGFSKMSRMS